MKFCKDNEKCQSCEHKDLCEAFSLLVDAATEMADKHESDEQIKRDVEEMLRVNSPMVMFQWYKHIDKQHLCELAEVLVLMLDRLYRSWEHKCEEIDKLKVQLEAQETISHA